MEKINNTCDVEMINCIVKKEFEYVMYVAVPSYVDSVEVKWDKNNLLTLPDVSAFLVALRAEFHTKNEHTTCVIHNPYDVMKVVTTIHSIQPSINLHRVPTMTNLTAQSADDEERDSGGRCDNRKYDLDVAGNAGKRQRV